MRPDWKPVTEPPPVVDDGICTPRSADVLGYVDGRVIVVYYQTALDDGLDGDLYFGWRTADSECWDITGRVTHWADMVEGPL